MQATKRGFAILALVILLVGTSGSVQYQTPTGRYYWQTGHWITGEFLNFYLAAPNPSMLFGFPITEAFSDPMKPGTTIQYFQKARMEYNPNAIPGKRITLAPLGLWLYDAAGDAVTADVPTNTGACRIFGSTGLPVCFAFLQFYDMNKGEIYLGSPISEMKELNGRIVQYFESARLEWIPERPAGLRVGLADLGRMDFDRRIGDSRMLLPVGNAPNILQTEQIELRVHAFVSRSLARPNDQQKVFIIVQNQNLQPIANANVMITVLRPDGKVENYRPTATNADGLTEATFTVAAGLPNQLSRVDVQVELLNGPKASAVTWFRIWW